LTGATSARIRPPRARGKKLPLGEPADHALGRSRGGFGTKIHLVTDGHGLPLAVTLSAGQAHESRFVEPALNAVRIPQRVGRPKRRPERVAGDKGYSYPAIRAWLTAHHIRPVIPERKDQVEQRAHCPGRKPAFDRDAYRRRNVIERTVGWLKEARGLATRFEKLAVHYLAIVKLAILEKYLHVHLADKP
jgi:transposase